MPLSAGGCLECKRFLHSPLSYLLALRRHATFLDMKATITRKGQITIPARLRRKLRLQPGQILEFDEDAPCLKATRVFDPNEMYGTIGCCKDTEAPGRSAEQWLNKTRGKVRLPKERNEDRG